MYSKLLSPDVVLWVGFFCFLIFIVSFYHNNQPYMDEVFHVAQTQQYCNNNFYHWDKKITTFPGLYIIAVGIIKLFGQRLNCSTKNLRIVNVLIASILPILFKNCRKQLFPGCQDSIRKSFTFTFYPINFFYFFMFYTDTISTTSLLVVHFLCKLEKRCNPLLLAMAGSFSIMTRQTNAIWLFFIAGTKMLDTLKQKKLISDDHLSIKQFLLFIELLWMERTALLIETFPILFPIIPFGLFVIWSGGIVLGDKDNHIPTVSHWAMLSHALCICGFLSLPSYLSTQLIDEKDEKKLQGYSSSSTVIHFVSFLWSAFSLHYGVKSHPFLLADNRHYTFYIWRRILQFSSIRTLLIIPYTFLIQLTITQLLRVHGPLWIIIFVIGSALTLITTPLLEPRYFTPTVLIFLLHFPTIPPVKWSYFFDNILIGSFLLIDLVFIYVYLFQTYAWVDGSIARFMF